MSAQSYLLLLLQKKSVNSDRLIFPGNLNPDKVMAMLNIEMIGTESKWGKNSAYIPGYDKSDMGSILQKNLVNSPVQILSGPLSGTNVISPVR